MSDSNEPIYDDSESTGESYAPQGEESADAQPEVRPPSTPKPMRVARPSEPDDYRPESPALQNPNAPAVFHSPDDDEEEPQEQAPPQAVEDDSDEGTTGAAVDLEAQVQDSKPFIENIKLSGIQLLGFGVGLLAAFLIGYYMYRPMGIPCLILSLLIGTALPRMVATWRVSKWKTSAVLLGVTFILYVLLIFLIHPLWARDRESFSSALVTLGKQMDDVTKKVTTTASKEIKSIKGEDKEAEKPKKKKKKAASISAELIATNVGKFLRDTTNLRIWQRMLIFLQLIILTGAFLYLPVFIMAATPGLGSASEDAKTFRTQVGAFFLSAFHKTGKFSVVRLFKAILMSIIAAVGLLLSGIAGFWFIAVIVGLVSMICNLGPVIAVVLGAILVPIATLKMRAVIGLLITLGVLILTEKKLDWYLRLVPMSKRYGLPPEMLTSKKGASGAGLKLLAYLPSLISLAVIAALVLGVYLVCDVYKVASERNSNVREAKAMIKDHRTEEAIEKLEAVLEKHPSDCEAMLALLKARLKKEDFSGTLEMAEGIADPPDVKVDSSFVGRIKGQVAEFTDAGEGKRVLPEQGYKEILRQVADQSNRTNLQKRAAERIAEINPDSAWSDYGHAVAAYHLEEYEDCIAHASRGIEKNEGMTKLLLVKAQALVELKNYAEARTVCNKLLELDSEDEKARALMARIRGAESQPPDPDPVPDPEGDPEPEGDPDGE